MEAAADFGNEYLNYETSEVMTTIVKRKALLCNVSNSQFKETNHFRKKS